MSRGGSKRSSMVKVYLFFMGLFFVGPLLFIHAIITILDEWLFERVLNDKKDGE